MQSTLVIVFVLLIIDLAAGELQNGDFCSLIDDATGTCKYMHECDSVYQQLLSGKRLEQFCGYDGQLPIVCCPENINVPRSTSKPSTPGLTTPKTRRTTSTPSTTDKTKSIAEQMCSVYAKSVYAMVDPPILMNGREPVNKSLCVLNELKLIVGGSKAESKEFPHMAAVGYNGNSPVEIFWFCGGTLLSDRFVMTAAHCTYDRTWGDASWVRVGALNLKGQDDDSGVQQIRVIERIRHQEYKRPLQYHDIALLKLETSVEFTAWVRPACLPNLLEGTPPEKAIATGWGDIKFADEKGSDDLLKVTMNIVPPKKCNSTFIGDSIDSRFDRGIDGEWQICAGERGKDTCQGDSGGPLVVFNSDHYCMYTVIGVTSVGKLCGDNIPGIYTRVQHYVPWLEKKIWGPESFDDVSIFSRSGG